MEKYVIYKQGSATEPYELELTLDSITISCTCQAANMGLPCKHRINVLNGHTYDVINKDDENVLMAISVASDTIRQSVIPKYLKEHEAAKKNLKAKNEAAEKIFKKQRDAIIALALKKGTKSATEKASADLNNALQDCVNAAAEVEGLLKALQTVFIRP
ncbi:MAG: hypothetical protein FWC97_00530 [Treponema sp.]|nr:hypothetical protein [Treponema sp.]